MNRFLSVLYLVLALIHPAHADLKAKFILSKVGANYFQLHCENCKSQNKVTIPAELLRSQLKSAFTVESWYFESAGEEAKFQAFKNGSVLTVGKAVQRRFGLQHKKIFSFADSYCLTLKNRTDCAGAEVQRLRKLATEINSSFDGQSNIPQINTLIFSLIDEILNAPMQIVTRNKVFRPFYYFLSSFLYAQPIDNFIPMLSMNWQIQKNLTTQYEWLKVMGYNPSFFSQKKHCPQDHLIISGVELCPQLPVENMTYNMANDFVNKLNFLFPNQNFKIPTSFQWEFAARAGTQTKFFFGDNESELEQHAWYISNSELQTHPVGTKKPNPWGLYDMHGNLWQFVDNPIEKLYNIQGLDFFEGKNGFYIRGGSWIDHPKALAVQSISRIYLGWTCYDVGLRLTKAKAFSAR